MAKTTTPTTTPEPAAAIVRVPVKHLRESPFNPRKHYSQAALQELADSIKAQGLLQPIVARDLPAGQQDIWVRHEIVFGHRRFRAAQLAGLDEVDVVIRPFTDEQAALAQVAENLQRQDVSQLEEADSFVRLHQVHGMSADQIAAGVNKSRSYVYGRLKLAKMAPEVRNAMAEEDLPADIAIEVARIVDHALQKKALKTLKERNYTSERWLSVRQAQTILRGMYDNDVDKAPFDPNDATLAKLAGPCTTCPKRAGNDPDLQGIVAAGVCTDVACYEGKVGENARIEVIVLRNAGHPVIQGAQAEELLGNRPKFSVPKGFEDLEGGDWIGQNDDHKHRTYAEMLELLTKAGQDAPKTTVISTGGVVRHFLTEAQADDVMRRADALLGGAGGDKSDDGTPTPSTAARAQNGGGKWPFQAPDHADWTPAERVVANDGWMRVKEAVLRNLVGRPRTVDDLRVILLREYDQADGFGPITEILGLDAECDAAENAFDETADADEFSYRGWWEKKLASLPPDTLAVILLGASLWDFMGYGGGGYTRAQAAARVALAERYGVDVVAASQPDQSDDAGSAGGPRAQASAPSVAAEQLDAFGPVPA